MTEYRYERKALIEGLTKYEVENMVKMHPALFSRLYPARNVNNIYLDTTNFDSYFDNVEGATDRIKARIRWYGDLFGDIESPVLEYKIKKGLLGRKKNYPLKSLTLDKEFTYSVIKTVIENSAVPDSVNHDIKQSVPTLLNRYKREYYSTGDEKFRITIDSQMCFSKIHSGHNSFLDFQYHHEGVVVEMKYNDNCDNDARNIMKLFPFRMTKNSKYVNGIDMLYDI